jgi:hypothetical protein
MAWPPSQKISAGVAFSAFEIVLIRRTEGSAPQGAIRVIRFDPRNLPFNR